MNAPDTTDAARDPLGEQLDRLSQQLDAIAAELAEQRRERQKWSELVDTLQPVTKAAMDMATAELEDLSRDVTIDDARDFLRALARNLPQLTVVLEQLGSVAELLAVASSMSGQAMQSATDTLQVADEKGYFAFARQGGKIADRIVSEFTEEDVAALGDNVVTILSAVKEMTQPEVMALVQRTALTVQEGEDTHVEPPSMFSLVKSMREPQTRRGLARVISMLNTVGEENPTLTQRMTDQNAASSTRSDTTKGEI